MISLHKAAHYLRNLVPLTARAVIIIITCTLSWHYIAHPDSDLIITLLAINACILLAGLLILSIVQSNRIRTSLKFSHRIQSDRAYAKEIVAISHTIRGAALLPCFSVVIKFTFKHPGVQAQEIVITGKEPRAGRNITSLFTFPHRGIWELSEVAVVLRDRFGFSARNFTIPTHAAIAVYPKLLAIHTPDLYDTTATDGDMPIPTATAQGDYYDFKEYNPADGLRKVAWKLFAKSGELFVRHPEPEASPVGKTIIYAIAGAQDDAVAGASLFVLQQLQEQRREFVFATDGTFHHSTHPAETTEDAMNILATTVWDATAGTGAELGTFIAQVKTSSAIDTIYVLGNADAAWLSAVSQVADEHQISARCIAVPHDEISNSGFWRYFSFLHRTTKPSMSKSFHPSNDSNTQLTYADRI